MGWNASVPLPWGTCGLKSALSLEELGEILSDKIFGGLKFGGKEKYIHEEIPAIFISSPLLGLLVVLDGFTGFHSHSDYRLYIKPWGEFSRYIATKNDITHNVDFNYYLYLVLAQALQSQEEILVVKPELYENDGNVHQDNTE